LQNPTILDSPYFFFTKFSNLYSVAVHWQGLHDFSIEFPFSFCLFSFCAERFGFPSLSGRKIAAESGVNSVFSVEFKWIELAFPSERFRRTTLDRKREAFQIIGLKFQSAVRMAIWTCRLINLV